jgi:Rrf2 family protein
MKLQQNTRLALYSLLEFAADPTRHIAASEIAQKYGVSPHHLAKVLAELARAGVVQSVRGVGGGYRFAGNARRLTMMEITLATLLRLVREDLEKGRSAGSGPA